MPYTVMVLGGYGAFGSHISRALSREPNLRLIIAGRDINKAREFTERLRLESGSTQIEARSVNIFAAHLVDLFRDTQTDLVIHTCGPFQGQDYQVARACIKAGVHYIDLADSRTFVCGINRLDDNARAKNVLAVAGASSVPGLSSAIIDKHAPRFKQLTAVEYGITPGNKMPRGLATVAAILSYCGQPFQRWEKGKWKTVYGWQNLHLKKYPRLMGFRWMGNCDVPDLQLFPARYPTLKSVKFYAGLELGFLHLGTWFLSWLVRLGVMGNLVNYAKSLKRASEWFIKMGSEVGGMHMVLSGVEHTGKQSKIRWYLIAESGHGPQIPCIPSILITKKLARGELTVRGAQPCMGLFTLDEFLAELAGLDIRVVMR